MKMTDAELDEFMREHAASYSHLQKLHARGGWQVLVRHADGSQVICYGTSKPDLIRHVVAAVKGEAPATGTDLLAANRVARLGLIHEIGKLLLPPIDTDAL